MSRVTEVKSAFQKFSPARPIIMRLADHLKVYNEGCLQPMPTAFRRVVL